MPRRAKSSTGLYAPKTRLTGLSPCPQSDSNRHCADFKNGRPASAGPRPPGWPTYPAPVRRHAARLEIILAATDLVAWTKLIGFHGHTDLATCEIATFRYRVLHVAAGITRGGRKVRLRIDATWPWATAICQAWQRLRAAFP